MAIQSEAATTVAPQKWLGILQRWCPAVPTAELVAFINLLIEAAGPRRVEWLDDLIVQADNQLRRTGAWKMDRLKQYAEAMSKRVTKKKAAEEKVFNWLIEQSHAHPEYKQPELFEKARRTWGERILTRAIWRRVVARPGLERLRRAGRPVG
jgi:hypothetical protein